MQRVMRAVFVGAVCLWASPVLAQGGPGGTIVDTGYIGVNTGLSVVEKFGGVFGAEGGLRVWRDLDAVGEIFWSSNVVTSRHVENIERLAAHVGQTQGGSASGSIGAPMLFGGLGVRWVFEETRFKPYVMLTLGAARTELEPELLVNGVDVSGNPATVGITFGRDVIGTSNDFAAETGIGIVMGYDAWYFDAGARLLSINADQQRINVARIVVGGGYRF